MDVLTAVDTDRIAAGRDFVVSGLGSLLVRTAALGVLFYVKRARLVPRPL